MKCPECGADNGEERTSCQKCGVSLSELSGETIEDASPSAVARTASSPKEVATRKAKSPEEARGGGGHEEVTEFLPSQRTPGSGASSKSGRSGQSSKSSPSASSSGWSGSASGKSYPRSSTGEIQPNTIFGNRYQILELLGEGGMGQVYKALDKELDRVIALKTIRMEKETDPNVVQRFKRELVLARKVTHKNVVRIHDLGEAEGIKYFTMEFIEGESLKKRIRRRGRIAVPEAVAILRQLLGALQEAHSQGVIHRDLKPQNIMMDENGVPMLMDFGIARSAQETSGMTGTGVMIGTPDYMSPEQVRGEKADARSDLFSLGVILYEMLTGDLPYQAETPLSKVMMRLTHKPRAPRQITLEVPHYLEQVVLKCMEVDPELRYQSAQEVLTDLDREQVDHSLTLRAQRALAKRKRVYLAAAAVVVATVAGWSFLGPERPAVEIVPEGPVTTLAILPFTNAAGSEALEWLRTGLPEMLVTDIAQSRFIRPVPGDRVLKILRELGIADNVRFDEVALDSVSTRASAESVLYGQFVESGGELRLDLTLRKAGSGVPVPLQIEGATADVFGLVDLITRHVKENLDLTPEQLRGDTDRPIAEVSTGSLEALTAYQKGLAELQRAANHAAIPFFRDATTIDPEFATAFAKLSEAYLNTGDYIEAGAAIERAQSLSESRPLPLAERYQIHATAALLKGDFAKAAESYRELATLYPDDADIQLNLARTYEELGNLPEAAKAYGQVVELAPDYGAAVLGLGRVHVMSGNPDAAIGTLEQALTRKQFASDLESLGMLHSVLGVAYRDKANLDKAMEHFNRSLEVRREAGDRRGEAATMTNIALVYDYLGKAKEALGARERALAIAREMGDPLGVSNYLIEVGLAHKTAGDLDKALAAFRESLQIEREREDRVNLPNRLNNIAEVYRLKGQYDDAIVYLDQARTLLQSSENVIEKAANFNSTALVQKAQGRYEESLASFREALPLLQEMGHELGVAEIHHNLAFIYVSQGRYGDAHQSLQKSLEIFTRLNVSHGVEEVKVPLGHLFVTLGLLEEAENQFAEVGRDESHGGHGAESPEILFGRARIADFRGDQEKAAQAYEQANIQANLSGRKEVAVESRIELGRLYLRQGKLPNAERLLARTRREAADVLLRPLESEAAAVLAEVYIAKGDSQLARTTALEAISIAEKFSGRPVLCEAYLHLGEALTRLGRTGEAMDSFAKGVEHLDWIRTSLLPEHVDSFMGTPDVQTLLTAAARGLESGGKSAEANQLKKWLKSAPAATSGS